MIDPVFHPGPSVVVALIVLGILVFLETRRRQRFLFLRIASQVLLVSSLLVLTLRPALRIANRESLILLTNGYDQKVIDSLTDLTPISFKSYNDLSKLDGVGVIAGNGLPSWALGLLPSKNYSFIQSAEPQGITAIETDEHIYAHRWNNIRGIYNGEATLKLRGPGGIDDSVKVANGAFDLSFFAKAPGRFSYDVITPDGSETLPMIIEPERIFNIIFVSNYPTFELRYLKNFLASKGHRLLIRNQVSKGKYKFEFANRPPSNFQSITSALLSDADLMILDEDSWSSLGSGEQRNIRSSIDEGLGVIVIPTKGKGLMSFQATQQKDTVRMSLGKAGSIRLPASTLATKQSNPILTSGDRVVSGYVYSGSGKIGYQLLMETYQAGLQGKTEIYSALWVSLLEKCARTQKEDFKLRITSPFPYYENEPLSLDIISSGKEPALNVDNIRFPLTEDVFIDDLWHANVWLEGNSWHELAIDSARTFVHVAKDGAWRSIRARTNQKVTAKYAGAAIEDRGDSFLKDDRLPKIILFMIFILASGFLWLAPKI